MLNIISAYRGIVTYIRAASQHSQPDWGSLWKQHAIEPYWQSWAAGIPWCAGYTLGYRLVQNYLKKQPGLSWVELLDIDPCNLYKDFI